jgi:hypothetical protein
MNVCYVWIYLSIYITQHLGTGDAAKRRPRSHTSGSSKRRRCAAIFFFNPPTSEVSSNNNFLYKFTIQCTFDVKMDYTEYLNKKKVLACCAVPLHLRWLPNALKSQRPSISTYTVSDRVLFIGTKKKAPFPRWRPSPLSPFILRPV